MFHQVIEPLQYDDDDYGWEDDGWDDYETACYECGKPGVDNCQCCGVYLCVMHSEIGAGFCKDCPTRECIEEYQRKL